MKITNRQFVDRYLKDLPAREVLTLLEVVKTLLIRHQIESIERMDDAQGDMADMQAMVRLLNQESKLKRADVTSIIRMYAADAGLSKQFTLISSDNSAKGRIQDSLSSDASLELQESLQVGIMLQGDSRIYKRTLKSDVSKLLR